MLLRFPKITGMLNEGAISKTQTNYDEKKNYFDTSSVEEVLELVLKVNPHAVIVI